MDEAEQPIFVYGSLRDDDVLRLTLGDAAERLQPVAAVLKDHETLKAADGPFPVLRTRAGAEAPGLLLQPMDPEVRARLDFFEASYDYALAPRRVQTADGEVPALVYVPGADIAVEDAPWDLDLWRASDKALLLEIGAEILAHRLGAAARGRGLLVRAIQRQNAAQGGPAALRRRPAPGDLVRAQDERLYAGFFVADALAYRHRRFDGAMSATLRREVLISGDAVTVLPWDPATDQVLLIEQVRAGLVARGDPNPWNLEVIAGLQDRAEGAEATARREAEEEAGLTLGRMVEIGGYYPSPGILSEYITGFIGEADLATHAEGVHGLASEDEDIRTLILPRSRAMALLDTGEARNAPLILSLMALERLRGRLTEAWGS